MKHRKITPYWPRANAQAESFNKPLIKSLRAACVDRKSWQQELHKILRIYRCTPHSTTRFTPYRLLFGREPRTRLPEISAPITDPVDHMVRSRDERAKRIMKSAAATRNHATDRRISVGDTVFTEQMKNNKLTPVFNASTLTVTERNGSMITAKRADGGTVTSNVSAFRLAPVASSPNHDDDGDLIDWPNPEQRPVNVLPVAPEKPVVIQVVPPEQPPVVQVVPPPGAEARHKYIRPRRDVKKPSWMTDFAK